MAGAIAPATSASAAPLQPVSGAGGIAIRLTDVPVDQSDPLARTYIVDRLVPGTTIQRSIAISNSTHAVVDVAVYPGAASLHRDSFVFAPSHERNELSSWTSVGQDLLHLAPGTGEIETVTIHVPQQASSGERYGVIWAEVSARAPAEGGVRLVNRVGIRVYLSVAAGGALTSNFVVGPLTAQRSTTGQPLVVAKIRNSGGRTLVIGGNLTLTKGPGGLRAGPFQVKVATLAPSSSQRMTVRLDRRLPRGPWQAQLQLNSGGLQRDAHAVITFPQVTSGGFHHMTFLLTLSFVLVASAAMTVVLKKHLG